MIPNYHSISDFRKDNPQALKKLFKLFVIFLKNADLISGETIAIDGTKSRAHNSKKANFSQKKIDRHMEYIDQKVEEYMSFWRLLYFLVSFNLFNSSIALSGHEKRPNENR